jgi:glycosyltransferase involved in cell wall biosynthesis
MSPSICFVSLPAYGYFSGGPAFGSRQFYQLSKYLSEEFDVSFIVGDYGQPERERKNGVTLHRSYTPNPAAGPVERVKQMARFADAVRRADADIYFVEGRPIKLLLTLPIIAAQAGKVVYHVVSDENVEARCGGLGNSALRVAHQLFKHLDEVITQTEYQQETLAAFHGVDSTVVPNGYPPADTIPDYDKREYFLWVGRLDERLKRPHLYLDVAERVPEAEFVFAGPREGEQYGDSLLNRATSLENVTYLGSVSPDEIHQYYRKAIALVNTSALEGFPNTFLEAWRYGTPVLSLSVNPNRYLNNTNDFIFAEGEIHLLSEAVNKLESSVELRRVLGKEGLRNFERKYNINKVGDRYAIIIEELL